MKRQPLQPSRIVIWGISILLAVIILLPIAAMMAELVPAGPTGPGPQAPRLKDSMEYLLRHYGDWMLFSLELALLSLALCLVIGLPAAYVLVRHPFPGSRVLEELTILPLSLPGIALSIALVAAYGRVQGPWLVLAGHLLYTLPFMVRIITGALRSADLGALEEAARSLGANPWQRARLVVLPALRHAILVGSLVVLAVSWGEFNVSYLLNRGEPQTYPAALYNTFANETTARSGAATILFLAVALPLGLVAQWLAGEESAWVEEAS